MIPSGYSAEYTFRGEGPSRTIIDGGELHEVLTDSDFLVELHCSKGERITFREVTLIRGGTILNDIPKGGGLANFGCEVGLIHSAVTNCKGPGIEQFEGALAVRGSTIAHNSVGIRLSGKGSLVGSAVINNQLSGTLSGLGGGVSNAGKLSVRLSTISNNRGFAGIGNRGRLVVIKSLISNNDGSGISNGLGGVATVTDSLISSNNSGESVLDGGGISLRSSGTVTLIRSTVMGNVAQGVGGGIFIDDFASLTLTGSLIAHNSSVEGGGVFNEGGTLRRTDTLVINNTPNDCVGC